MPTFLVALASLSDDERAVLERLPVDPRGTIFSPKGAVVAEIAEGVFGDRAAASKHKVNEAFKAIRRVVGLVKFRAPGSDRGERDTYAIARQDWDDVRDTMYTETVR